MIGWQFWSSIMGVRRSWVSNDERGTVEMAQVKDTMTSDVVTVESSTGIVEAAQRMIQQEKGPLPVMEGDQLHAMVTDRGARPRRISRSRASAKGRPSRRLARREPTPTPSSSTPRCRSTTKR
jgi:CBS domain-containing protein